MPLFVMAGRGVLQPSLDCAQLSDVMNDIAIKFVCLC